MENSSTCNITPSTRDRRRSSTSSSSGTISTMSSVGLNIGNLTPKRATEIVVNWAINTGQGDTLLTNLGPEYTSAFAMLDCRGLDCDSLRTPANLGYDMDSAIKDTAKSKAQLEVGAYLLYQLKKCPEYQTTRKSVEQEIDRELSSGDMAGILEPWDSKLVMSLDDKIIRVAEQRVMGSLFEASGSMPAREAGEDKHVEFQVQLERLVDGMGNYSQNTTLRFAYTTSYHDFLKALQEATSLCRIPPRHHAELGNGQSVYFKPVPLFHSANDDGQASLTDLASLEAPEQRRGSVELSIDSLADKEKPPIREVKGYTREDGAWIYRTIQSLDSTPMRSHEKYGGIKTIRDGADYREMILSLETENSGGRKKESEHRIGKATHTPVKLVGSSPPRMYEIWNRAPMLLDITNSSPFRMDQSETNTHRPSAQDSSPFRMDQSRKNTPRPVEPGSSPTSLTSKPKEYTFGIWIIHSQDYVEQGVWKKSFNKMREEDEDFRRRRALEGEDIPKLWSVYWEREKEKPYF